MPDVAFEFPVPKKDKSKPETKDRDSKSEPVESEDEPMTDEEMGQSVLDAIEEKDPKALALALKAFA